MITFQVLGSLQARAGDTAIELGGSRHREILARLLLSRGQAVSVDRLVDDVWGDEPPRHAIATVRTLVFHLRQALEPHRLPRTPAKVLTTAASGYVLRAESGATDAGRFEAFTDEGTELLARNHPADALTRFRQDLELWRGSPYAEFGDYAWARSEISRLTELRQVAFEGKTTALLELGRAAEALPDLTAYVAEHPLQEEGWWLLALALYRSGRQDDALATLQRVRTLLREELGIDPGPRLRQLEADILAQDPGLSPRYRSLGPEPTETSTAETLLGDEPLAGRTVEVDRLARLAARAGIGHRQVILVEGPAGIGKTTLVTHLHTRLSAEGWTIGSARCPELAGAPGGWPWWEILDQLVVAHHAPPPELARSLGGAAAGLPVSADNATADLFRFCGALVEYLKGVTADGPVLLVVEDLHFADADTLIPLVEVVRRLGGHRLLVIGTLRPGPPSAPLANALGQLAVQQSERIELGGLDAAAVASLVRMTSALDTDAELAARITDRTGGNPFLVREVARQLAAEGPRAALSQVPSGVRDVLGLRLASLPESVRTLLRHAAVLGDEFDLDVLAALVGDQGTTGLDYEAVVDGIEVGLAAGILDDGRTDGTVRFTHALMYEAVYAGISAPRRALWHRRAATVLERLQPGNVAALARHHLYAPSAQSAAAAIGFARAAADQAAARFAYLEAERLRRAALTLVDRFGETTRERLILVGELIEAHAYLGNRAAMRELQAAAVEPLTALADPAVTARIMVSADPANPLLAERRVNPQYGVQLGRVVELLERNLRALPLEDSELRVLLLTKLADKFYGDSSDRGRQAAAEAMAIAERIELSPETRAEVLIAAHTQTFWVPGKLDERARVAAELVELAGAHHLVASERLGLLWQIYTAERRGDLAETGAAIAELDRHSRRYDHPPSAARVLWHRAMLLELADASDTEVAAAYRVGARALEDAGVQRADKLLVTVDWCRAYRAGRAAEFLPELMRDYPNWPASAPRFALTLALAGERDRARHLLRTAPPPPQDASYELDIALIGLAAVLVDEFDIAADAYRTLLPIAGEIIGPGACVLLPARRVLDELAVALDHAPQVRADPVRPVRRR
ncbi:AfsR/SARP family transcriptional regulator [Nocardia acidivorans]|uniref:AfsR/SARP family transcriptional regulator n=1 Tax=Nocardia acidivorans TaxID=404580 RepID=UPI000834F7A2|nr:AfsR/SARP family transcriptional regulator [Nocardia acidivorans]